MVQESRNLEWFVRGRGPVLVVTTELWTVDGLAWERNITQGHTPLAP
jgi:hypothetical protein